MMNSPFVAQRANLAAEMMLAREENSDREAMIRYAYQQTLGRLPSKAEAVVASQFLAVPSAAGEQSESKLRAAAADRWADLYLALFCSIDFRYID
jgi:hypothetical protein